jgi:ABC-2 type transport system permease protein
MRNILAICNKELKGYYASPIAYLLLTIFAILFGYFFYAMVSLFALEGMDPRMGQRTMNVNQQVIAPLFSDTTFVSLFVIPMISMRLFAEEKRQGTMELLLTSPIADWEIVLGKFLGAMLMYGSLLGIAALDIALLFIYGKPAWGSIATGFLGLLLQGGCLLALGEYISTTTKNQIVAAGATFGLCLLLFVLSWMTDLAQTATAKVIAYMSVNSHYEPFAKGLIDTKDIVFYVTVIFLGLFLTTRSLESLRWRA